MKSTIKVAAMASVMAAILGACTASPPQQHLCQLRSL